MLLVPQLVTLAHYDAWLAFLSRAGPSGLWRCLRLVLIRRPLCAAFAGNRPSSLSHYSLFFLPPGNLRKKAYSASGKMAVEREVDA